MLLLFLHNDFFVIAFFDSEEDYYGEKRHYDAEDTGIYPQTEKNILLACPWDKKPSEICKTQCIKISHLKNLLHCASIGHNRGAFLIVRA